eukprot:TRINITY_DN11232_c0_g1_i1.p2 TRINITY_DN11232_c0_g1~~TRINITY_DN11232_c0_g1_i1.p2  ORF type:complete len:231 (-),score=66.32 TRINITY_DN11232_c0_g1_i1:111-803(-)
MPELQRLLSEHREQTPPPSALWARHMAPSSQANMPPVRHSFASSRQQSRDESREVSPELGSFVQQQQQQPAPLLHSFSSQIPSLSQLQLPPLQSPVLHTSHYAATTASSVLQMRRDDVLFPQLMPPQEEKQRCSEHQHEHDGQEESEHYQQFLSRLQSLTQREQLARQQLTQEQQLQTPLADVPATPADSRSDEFLPIPCCQPGLNAQFRDYAEECVQQYVNPRALGRRG